MTDLDIDILSLGMIAGAMLLLTTMLLRWLLK
jgi:hypothetical protein